MTFIAAFELFMSLLCILTLIGVGVALLVALRIMDDPIDEFDDGIYISEADWDRDVRRWKK